MAVKPITLLTKNSGGDGLPTNLLVNVARYSSVKKLPRTPDSDSGWERDTDHVNPGGVNAATGGLMMSPELRSKEMMVNGGHETHQPSLHSPDMRLSTKGMHAKGMHARDELSSLRSRLESLRGGSGGEHRNWSRNPAGLHYRKSDGDASADDSVTNGDQHHHHHHHRNVYNHSGGRNQHRIQTLEARTSNGNGNGSTTTTAQGVGNTEKVMRGASLLELEKLANGGLRLHEKNSKDRNHRRQRNNQPAAPPLEYLSNGDVEMVYETDDRTFSFPSEKLAMSSHPNPNPVRQVVHDIAEKAARRTRNRVHHQSPEVRHSEDQRVDTSGSRSAVGSRNNNSRVDDVNRIHQRPLLHLETRDAAAGVSDLDSFNLDHEMRVADAGQQLVRTNYRSRQQSPNHMIMTHGLQREESSMVRALSSSHKSSIRSDQSGHHSHGMISNGSSVHPSSHHVEVRDDHVMQGISQPASARSSSHHAQDSPFKQSFRTNYPNFEARDGLPAHLSLLHAAGGEHSSSSNNRGRDVAHPRRNTQVGQTWFAATELQSNLLVEVADCRFHLHKFPLLSRSGRLNRLVFESRDTNKDHIKLIDMPGGPEAFELAVKFCYGIEVDLTPLNVATLRCAAEYLEMTDSLEDDNLVSKAEHYLSFVVLASWKDSITVLQSCHRLLPWAEELQIVRRCSESVAWKACTDPHGIRWSFSRSSTAPAIMWDGGKQTQVVAKHIPHDWWVEDVIQLNFDAFSRVITAIKVKGMAYTLVGSAIAQYATKWLPGLEKKSKKQQQHTPTSGNKEQAGFDFDQGRVTQFTGKEIVVRNSQDVQMVHNPEETRALVEGIVSMLPPQQDAVSCSFLLRLLRSASMLCTVPPMCKAELERRVGIQMEHASLSDLLIPSSNTSADTTYDLDTVQRILEQFLKKDQSSATSPTQSIRPELQLQVLDPGSSKPHPLPHMSKSKVAKLFDAYLVEVARDPNLSLARFQSLASALPEFSRASDDGLYRAVDTYLKTHPTMTEHERKKLCRIMDCQRLSLEACLHAAQNERLPLRVVVQVLFSEQVKLRNVITGNTLVKKPRDHRLGNSASARDQSESESNMVIPRLDNSMATGLSLQESLQTAFHEIKSLTQEVERMKSKFVDLEQDYSGMTNQVEKLSKSKSHSTSGWTSGWRRLSSHMKPPSISLFSHSKPELNYHQRDDVSIATATPMSTPMHDQSMINPSHAAAAAAEARRRSHSVTSTSSIQRWRNSVS